MIAGAVVVLSAIAAAFVIMWHPSASQKTDRISVAIDTPYVGQGVREGTAIVMHGVQVGVVKSISSLPGGGVRVLSDLQKGPTAELTDTMKIEFRPINYFGVTGITVAAASGGRQLRDGIRINTVPQPNATLQAVLSRLGEVSVSALTPQLISVIDRAVRYTDALNPLIETVLIATHAVADVQNVSTARLLTNTTGVAVAFPTFTDALLGAGEDFTAVPRRYTDEQWRTGVQEAYRVGSTELFGGFGRLESNYVDDLLPAIDGVKALTDPVPALFRPDDFANTLVQLRTRLQKLFAGNGEQRALQVKIVLDNLPGVAAPLAAMGGPQ
ncbi:Mammalian cell entry related domain protein [Mycobacterium sp. 663a-19]|uniref:Mammalian cell entry related domain protein n=1 Tax=Mycobacterium sp. 663a-19 TaxID=2986148 RepID=UPI002D1EEC8D|nr:Mammalian cell entry related domain protein [Mycobacterium sp. 663a-19]MEB3980098.1 Mammalian cell entry related domain protein [Mycobacterium sp. 663a-19]